MPSECVSKLGDGKLCNSLFFIFFTFLYFLHSSSLFFIFLHVLHFSLFSSFFYMFLHFSSFFFLTFLHFSPLFFIFFTFLYFSPLFLHFSTLWRKKKKTGEKWRKVATKPRFLSMCHLCVHRASRMACG